MSLSIPAPSTSIPAHPALPPIDDILEFRISLIDHIPRSCRDSCAAALSSLHNAILADPSFHNWHALFLFPKVILFSPLRGGRSSARSLPDVIKDRLQRWSRGEFLNLWSDARGNQEKLDRKNRRRQAQAPVATPNARRAEKLARSGQYGRAVQALSSLGLAEDSDEVFRALESKHPQAPPPTLPDGPAPDSIRLSEDLIKSAISSFNADTAPGPSGFKANFLKDLLATPNPNQRRSFLRSLTALINSMNEGNIPPSFRPFLFASTLHAAKKKCGGIRPVAIGETYARLTSKCLAFSLAKDVADLFAPHQLGIKVRGGCESVIHAASALFHSSSEPSSRLLLQVDLENAFNNIDRSLFLQETRSHLPSLSSWAETSYGSPSHLFFRGRRLQSSQGTRQGDPIAGILFGLGLHPTILRIQEQNPNLQANMWIMDDGTICGTRAELCSVISILEEEGPSRGLLLNKNKSLVWVGDLYPNDDDP